MTEPINATPAPATIDPTSTVDGQVLNDDPFTIDGEETEVDGGENPQDPQNPIEPSTTDNPDDGGEGDPSPEDEDTPPSKPKEGEENPNPENKPEEGGEPRKYAGKYDSPEQLKAAFIQLGGDPAVYGDNIDAVEQAYEVRQAEFTRARQEQAEKARLEIQQRQEALDAKKPVFTNEQIDGMLDKVDWSKVNDARDLGRALLTMLGENLPRNNGQQLTEEQIAGIVQIQQAKSAEREAKLTELHSLEAKVPRLKSDIAFRNSFANYLEGLKANGGYVNLESSMKDFIKVNQTIVEEGNRIFNENQQAKSDAATTTPPDIASNSSAVSQKNTPEDDILESIIGEYKQEKGKFSF